MAPPMPEYLFYHDLSNEDQAHFASLLEPQTSVAFITPLTYVAWKHHPVSYVSCNDDHALPLAKQHSMVSESGIESEVGRFEIDSSHSPFLSKPKEIVDVIKKVMERSQSV